MPWEAFRRNGGVEAAGKDAEIGALNVSVAKAGGRLCRSQCPSLGREHDRGLQESGIQRRGGAEA